MPNEVKEVCPTTTLRMVREGALMVDVRERSEVDAIAFDVPDLVVIPLSEFGKRFVELPRDRDLVMVCRVGERSLRTTYYLMRRGYTRVANMKGGINRWIAKGFPVKGDVAAAMAASASGCCCGSEPTAAMPSSSPKSAASPSCGAAPDTTAGACC